LKKKEKREKKREREREREKGRVQLLEKANGATDDECQQLASIFF